MLLNALGIVDRLSGSEQLLVLSNLDRVAYGLPPINGLSPALNTVAAAGVNADADPDPSALLHSMSSFGWSSTMEDVNAAVSSLVKLRERARAREAA